ncbi:MAG: PD-(D/E)XK nuclease family protein [Elusimicrobiota bacterium]|jgi:putative RecB family exonuclease
MYSNSRIETFEKCPRKYKFRYVDNLRTDTEGVEAFVGKRVHEALEKLYRDLKYARLNTLDEVLQFYEQNWEKNWHGKIQVVRSEISPGDYFKLGRQCLTDYYKHYHPFNQGKTIGLEERIELKLTEGAKTYSVQGYIDRLTWVPETETYEIHDYKTGANVPTQKEADEDRQLALYQLGIMQRWPDAKRIKLIWHYLATDKEIASSRQAADLKELESEVIGVIRQIEQETTVGRWETHISRLCEWCEYKPICPAFKHLASIESLPPNAYLQNTGVQLVQKYAELEEQKESKKTEIAALQEEQKKVEEAVFAYSEKEGVTALDGPGYRLLIKSEDEWKAPRKTEDPFAWELLRTTLKNAGKLEDVSTVNANMLRFAMRKGKWPADLVKSITGLISTAVRKTISLTKKS